MADVKYYPLWNEIYDKFKDVDYNGIITYEQLNKCLGFDIRDKRYIFQRFRKELLRCNDKALECILGKGYRVVNPNEHSRLVCMEIKKAERRTRQGVEYALHVPFDMLDDVEKAQLTMIANRIQNVHSALVGESKSIKSIAVEYELPGTPRFKGDK